MAFRILAERADVGSLFARVVLATPLDGYSV